MTSLKSLKYLFELSLLLIVIADFPAQANDTETSEAQSRRANEVITAQIENDFFLGRTDQDYTNGLRLSYAFEPEGGRADGLDGAVSGFLSKFSSTAGRVRKDPSRGHLYYTLGLGQNMYTPDDITIAEVIEEDRPYAGWTYLTFGVVAEDDKSFEALGLDLGIVGPSSGAGAVQRWWHRVIDVERPEGWANQLPDEPGVNLHYVRGWRTWIEGGPDSDDRPGFLCDCFQMDVMPHLGFSLGNVYTHAAAGLTVRIGTDLARDVGAPPRIQPALPGSVIFTGDKGFDFYVFAGAEARLVGRNIFLDGTWRSNPHSVDSSDIVADLQVGAVLLFNHWRVAFTRAWRTSEYVGSDVSQQYGALTVSYRF